MEDHFPTFEPFTKRFRIHLLLRPTIYSSSTFKSNIWNCNAFDLIAVIALLHYHFSSAKGRR